MINAEFAVKIGAITVDTVPLFVQLAADTVPARKEIDALYAVDGKRYRLAAERSPYRNHPLFVSGDIEREIYARRYLGLLLAAIGDGRGSPLFAKVFGLMSKRWTRLQRYVDDCREVDLATVVDPQYIPPAAIRPPVGTFLSGVTAHFLKAFGAVYPALDLPHQAALKYALFAACACGRGVTVSSRELLPDVEALGGKAPGAYAFRDFCRKLNKPDLKKMARDLKNGIFQQVCPDPQRPWCNDRYVEGWAECGAYLSSEEGISLIRHSLLVPPKERDVDLLCRLYLIKLTAESFRFERVFQGKEEVETECAEFVLLGLVWLEFLRQYKKAKRYYFADCAEHLRGEIEVLKERICACEETVRRANDDVAVKSYLLSVKENQAIDQARQHKQEVAALRREIERLKVAARDARPVEDGGGATAPAETVDMPVITGPDTESDLERLKEVRAVVIGGTERWQAKLSSHLPHFVYLYGDAAGFDESLVINADIIFADIRFKFNHGCYYRLADIVRRHKKRLVFLSKTNTELAVRQMAAALG